MEEPQEKVQLAKQQQQSPNEQQQTQQQPLQEQPFRQQQSGPQQASQQDTQLVSSQVQKDKPLVKKEEQEEKPPENAIVFHFEVCQHCEQHAWCTHHNEEKYDNLFREFKAAIKKSIPNGWALKNQNVQQPSTGAFEITYKGIIIYSKKATGLFPVVNVTIPRIQEFLEDLKNKKDVSRYAKMKEVKFEPPKKPRDKPNFQQYMKIKEEEEKKEKERKQLEEKLQAEADAKSFAEAENKRLEEEKMYAEKAEKEQIEKKKSTESKVDLKKESKDDLKKEVPQSEGAEKKHEDTAEPDLIKDPNQEGEKITTEGKNGVVTELDHQPGDQKPDEKKLDKNHDEKKHDESKDDPENKTS